MKKIAVLLFILIQLVVAEETILIGGLEHPDVVEFSNRYNTKLREVWGVDSDITLVSQKDVDQINYKYRDGVGPNSVTREYLKRLSIESAIVTVLQLQEFQVKTRRKSGLFGSLSGEAFGELSIRYSYFELSTGDEIQTFVVDVSADKKLGLALRPVEKTVNMSVEDRDAIINELIEKSIRKSYKNFRNMITARGKDSDKNVAPITSDSDSVITN